MLVSVELCRRCCSLELAREEDDDGVGSAGRWEGGEEGNEFSITLVLELCVVGLREGRRD